MKRKILIVAIITLLVFTMVPIRETDAEKGQNTQIQIEIYGGFGLTIIIKNPGEEDLSNLDWKIDLSGMIFAGKTKEGNISVLGAGDETKINMFIFGIGPGTIGVTVGEASCKVADFFIIGPFVIM